MWVVDRPAFLLLLPLIPVLIYLRHLWPGRGATVAFPYAIWGGKGLDPPADPARLALAVAAASFWLGVAALVLALAGPQRVTREQSFISRGVDVVFVLDQSPSMAAQDFQPVNRFDAAREVIRSFVRGRANDPIGLVGFGLEAHLRVPPTLDYEHLLTVLDALHVLEMGDGTAIGMGLAVAALPLQTSTAPRRVIVLITDGVNNAGEILPETAAGAIASLGIDLYVVGIGGTDEVTIEFADPGTGRTIRGTIRESFDEQALRDLAAVAGGRYFFAGSRGALEAVLDTIDTVERVESRSLLRVYREPHDRTLLLAAMVLILVDFLVRRLLVREVFP